MAFYTNSMQRFMPLGVYLVIVNDVVSDSFVNILSQFTLMLICGNKNELWRIIPRILILWWVPLLKLILINSLN